MSELKLSGQITDIKQPEEIADGKYRKLVFIVKNNDGYEGAEKVFPFEIFEKAEGDRIGNFLEYNKVGDFVDVKFDIDCREGSGKYAGKYFTSLKAFRIEQDEDQKNNALNENKVDNPLDEDPPF